MSNNRYAALDSAASDHYFPASFIGDNHAENTQPTAVGTASGNVMRSVATDVFPMGDIPKAARSCKKLKEVSLPLALVGRFSRHKMQVLFDDDEAFVIKDPTLKNKIKAETIIPKGKRDVTRNLYLVPLKGNPE